MSRDGSDQWMQYAACRGVGINIFFTEENDRRKPEQIERQASRYCSTCPARLACVKAAIANHERHGVWGGVSFTRKTADRERRIAKLHPQLAPQMGVRIVERQQQRRDDVEHGTTTRYNRGCRCEDCREAKRRARAKSLGNNGTGGTGRAPKHGTLHTYRELGCRCAACRTSNSRYEVARRQAAREQAS